MRKPKNFARFYALLKRMPAQAKEGLKETLVRSFTDQRTDSLRDMTPQEYNAMCDSMEAEVYNSKPGQKDPVLKSRRSAVLTRLQKLGVNTADWEHVDRFCMLPTIAGKRFRELTKYELRDLVPKLEAIARKSPRNTKKERPNYILIDDLEACEEKPTQNNGQQWVETPVIPDWQLRFMLQNMDNSILN